MFFILNIAGFLSVNSDRRLLDATQSFKENVPVVYNDKYNISFWGLEGDPLGALSISEDGIVKRDEMVFQIARDHKKPIVMLLGGGYQKSNARVIARSILNLRQRFGLF